MRGTFRRIFASGLALVLLTWAMASIARAQTAVIEFDLPEQSLADSLRAVGSQSNINLLFDPPLVAGLRAPALKAQLTAREALVRLLAGTGVKHEFLNEKTVVLALTSDTDVSSAGQKSALPAKGVVAPAPAHAGTNGDTHAAQEESPPALQTQRLEEANAGERNSLDVDVDLGEVVVTGSRIRGAAINGPSPVMIISALEIERSGYATIQDYIRTIPQNYSDLTEENVALATQDSLGRGSGFNLRGIGADSTLVLLNGRRIAASGAKNGTFVDVSMIPASAVERIEVLTDGASALYGSDAIGGVVNIHLKRRLDGLDARLRYGQDDTGDTSERQAVASFGASWSSGSVLAIYERFEREPLFGSDRTLTSNLDYRSLGGGDFRNPSFTQPGNIFAVSGTLPVINATSAAIPAGQNGTALTIGQLTPGVLSSSSALLSQRSLLNDTQRDSVVLTFEQDISDALVAFVDGFASTNDSTAFSVPTLINAVVGPNPSAAPHPTFGNNPFNPFAVPVRVAYSPIGELGPYPSTSSREASSVAAGVKAALGNWNVTAYGTHGVDELNGLDVLSYNTAALNSALRTANPALALNLFGDGSAQNMAILNSVIQPIEFLGDGRITAYAIAADGPLFSVPGGEVKAAAGAEYRDESFDSWTISATTVQRKGQRHAKAAYGELLVPLLPAGALWQQLARLELTVAGRYEEYSDFGSTVDPKIGIAFEPFRDLLVRASWGDSFRAPALNELYSPISTTASSFIDPLRGNQQSTAQLRSGGNSALEPERAETLTCGVIYTPTWWPGFQADISRWQLDFEDRIIGATDIFSIFNAGRESLLPAGIIVRALPSAADIAAGRPGPLVSVDARALNASLADLTGFDVGLRYAGTLERVGELAFNLSGTYIDNHRDTVVDGLPMVEHVSTWSFPVDFRARASATWARNGWSAVLGVSYTDDYRNTFAQTQQQRVDDWTTVDLSAAHEWRAGVLDGLQLRLAVTNVLDEEPPFFNSPAGYDARNSGIVGRQWSLSISKRFDLL